MHKGIIFGLLLFGGLMLDASGAMLPPAALAPIHRVTPLPAAPGMTLPSPTVASVFVGGVAKGSKVPLARLPRIPQQTKANTATPNGSHRIRPDAASGAYISLYGTSCFSFGFQFPVGCVMTWQAEQLTPTGDTKQDYLIVSTKGNELTASATAVGSTYTGATGAANQTTLSAQGTYVLGTYDVTTSQWIAVVYVNAGQVFNIKVYSDPYHSAETYQFDASASNSAYIYLQNVSASDYFVVGVSQTAVSPNCVFMGPVPTPSPYTYPAHQLCNLTASGGVQAPGGNLSVTWPLSAALPAGSYTVEVYDLTQGYRLGSVQVSITGSSGTTMTIYPDDTGSAVDSSPYPPNNPSSPSPIIAWEGYYGGGGDQSASGLKATVGNVAAGPTYQWTMVDPQGQVLATPAATISSGTATLTINFGYPLNPYMLNPGQYPSNQFTLELFNSTSNQVVASQYFKVVGYASETQFYSGALLSTALSIPSGSSVVSGLRVTNSSNSIFNGVGDNFSKFIFSSGNDYATSSTTGNGIMLSTVSGATAPCSTTCTATTAVDSAGNAWTVQASCSAVTAKGECNIAFSPVNSSTTLAPGAYINLSNVTFFYESGAKCGKSCAAPTSELPQHGLQWSQQVPSYVPVYFTSGSTQSATAEFRIVGSDINGTRNLVTLSPPGFSVPFVGGHFFQSEFGQLDYNLQSPYNGKFNYLGPTGGQTVSAANDDILAITINNTGANTIGEIAITLPPLFITQGEYSQVDTLSSSSWTQVTPQTNCPNGTSGNWQTICYTGGIPAGNSATIYIDQPMTLQSFTPTDVLVQAQAQGQWFAATAASGTSSTPDGLYSFDNLGFAAYSLNASDMTAYFNPSSVGSGSTATLGFVLTNTSLTQDPNPDSIDALVLEAPSTGLSLNSTPSVTNAGWSYLGSIKLNGASTTQYWFGLCGTQFTKGAQQGASYGGPPTANTTGFSEPLSAKYNSIGTCSSETDAVGAGNPITVSNMQLTNFNGTGTQLWKIYAHGANGGAWSIGQTMTLGVTSESASVWFNQVNGNTVATNSVPVVSNASNSFQYAVKNTSQASQIGTIDVTLPGLDINGQNAYSSQSTPGYWFINNITSGGVTITAPGGQSDGTAGCTVNTNSSNTFNATNGGANGQIQINCTKFNVGDTIYVNFTASNPQVESDSYLFPATIDGSAAGTAWLGSDEISVAFSLGVDVVVNPSNPGPGGSTPVVSCASCAFSGSTIDFGQHGNNSTTVFGDVVRASIVYTGSTISGNTLQLYVSASTNPASTGSLGAELNTEVDGAHSTSGVTANQTAYTPVLLSNPGLLLGTAPEAEPTYGSTSGYYDIIENFELQIGTEAIGGYQPTLTYTVIVN